MNDALKKILSAKNLGYRSVSSTNLLLVADDYMEVSMDIFFDPAYGKLYELDNKTKCITFDYITDVGHVQNIFIRRPVPYCLGKKQYYDISTPYGYGGPRIVQASGSIQHLLHGYFDTFSSYCIKNNIVSEYVRFHLFENTNIRNLYYGEVVKVAENIVVDLQLSSENIWAQFQSKVRKNVNQAKKNQLIIQTDPIGEHLDSFLQIYYDTLDRNQADKFYYFPKSYFKNLHNNLHSKFIYFFGIYNGKPVVTELVLLSQHYAYSFLGGTYKDAFTLRANDFIKYEIIQWLKYRGIEKFILGGGHRQNDGIFQYKKSFSPNGKVSYYIGKKIHNSLIYDELVHLHSTKMDEINTTIFPVYRSNVLR